MLSVGSGFAGYRIERVIGSGGMGTVYLAQNPTLPRRDALKVLSAELSRNPEFQARFLREADIASRLDHPNIVSIYRRGETEDGQLWIAMQFVDGTNADDALREGTMTPARAVYIVGEVAKALDYAHRHHVVHRDVKPSNFLLSNEGGFERVLLGDFGIARALDDAGLTATGSLVATAAYAAPEVLASMPFDHQADLYSLGCALFRLLTGETPFFAAGGMAAVMIAHLEQPPPRVTAHTPVLPLALDPVIARALAKDPAHRFQSASDLAAAAAAALHGHPEVGLASSETISGPSFSTSADTAPWQQHVSKTGAIMAPPGPPEGYGAFHPPGYVAPPSPRQQRRNKWVFAVLSAVVLLVAGGITAIAIAFKDQQSPASAISSARPGSVVPLVAVPALRGLLLGTDEINAIMGAQLNPNPILDVSDGSSDFLVEKECAGPWAPAQQIAYAGSGWLGAVQQQSVEGLTQQVLVPRRTIQAVVNFVSAQRATEFLTKQKVVWAQCANRTVTFLSDRQGPVPERFGDFNATSDGTLTTTVNLGGALGNTCGRALAIRNNVSIDTQACSPENGIDRALAIVSKIAAKVPQQ